MGSGLDDILANSLILRQLIPYLPISAILALSSTCKTHQETLAQNPDVFRYLDLSVVASALPCRPIDIGGMTWRRDRVDEALTQDEFAAGPLRGIFSKLSRRGVLDNVQTMILDGLGVTAELVHDIITMDKFNVRILSIRECPFINERRLMQVLQTAVRPSRANDTPRVNGLYVLGPRRFQIPHAVLPEQSSTPIEAGVTQSVGAQIGASWNEKSYHALNSSLAGSDDRWYHSFGKLVKFRNSSEAVEWAATLKKCEGIIAFDAILCRGPRHDESRLTATDENGEISSESWLPPRIATVALGSGCQKCGTMPEGPATFDSSPMSQLPLLDPPPLRSSNIQQAQKPHLLDPSNKSFPPLFVRCEDCLRARWCERCMKWWCEDCYSESVTGKRFSEAAKEACGDERRRYKAQMPIRTYMCPMDAAETTSRSIISTTTFKCSSGRDISIRTSRLIDLTQVGAARDCFSCGWTCIDCKGLYIRRCRSCGTEYCLVDDDGSRRDTCAWCSHSGRRTRELY